MVDILNVLREADVKRSEKSVVDLFTKQETVSLRQGQAKLIKKGV